MLIIITLFKFDILTIENTIAQLPGFSKFQQNTMTFEQIIQTIGNLPVK